MSTTLYNTPVQHTEKASDYSDKRLTGTRFSK